VRRDTTDCLGAQSISLLDAESVLLVDDDHAEVGELHGLLQQCMRADDDARVATRNLVADLPLLLRCHRTREQRDPGGAVLAAELSGHGQRPEHVPDGPGMLGRKHFRRSQQRALVSSVDHLQHGEHGDDRLSGAHLTLQHPVHRRG
jgi:hypothetical protein